MTARLRQDEAMLAKWLEDIPQGRLGQPAGRGRGGAVPVLRLPLLPHRSGDQRGRWKGDVLSLCSCASRPPSTTPVSASYGSA